MNAAAAYGAQAMEPKYKVGAPSEMGVGYGEGERMLRLVATARTVSQTRRRAECCA